MSSVIWDSRKVPLNGGRKKQDNFYKDKEYLQRMEALETTKFSIKNRWKRIET